MKRLDMIFLKTFLYGIPVVAGLGVFCSGLYDPETAGRLSHAFNSIAGLVLALWVGLAIYLSIRLMVSGSLRNRILSRVAFMKERDEREVYLTGKAVKTVFLTSLAILIFLLCLSCFQFSMYRVPAEKARDGKTGMVSLGISFKLLHEADGKAATATGERKIIFSYMSLPLSPTGVILLLLVWHILCYNYTMRRLSGRGRRPC